MKAEVFYTSGQEEDVHRIQKLLQLRIHHSIDVTPHFVVSRAYENNYERHALATRYVKLLQASIPPHKALRLGVTSLSPYGFYVYSIYFERFYSIQGFSPLFPAVAIHGRMVMVPSLLSKSLLGVEDLSLFLPLHTGGVIEVDFNNSVALQEALTKVSRMLQTDIAQELMAHMSFKKDSDPRALAQEWGVDRGFIETALASRARESTLYDRLSCELDRESLRLGRWSRFGLRIRNNSEIHLPHLEVEIRGPVQIRPSRLEANVPARGHQELAIALKPEELGDFPLEIRFLLPEDHLLADWIPAHHIWLHVSKRKKS